MKVRFGEISVRGIRRWVDKDGKRHQQTCKFWQTLSPFNKGADGLPKTSQQIFAEVVAERDAWMKEQNRPTE
jgi:hypothetical protein